jgi:hypothetical protein
VTSRWAWRRTHQLPGWRRAPSVGDVCAIAWVTVEGHAEARTGWGGDMILPHRLRRAVDLPHACTGAPGVVYWQSRTPLLYELTPTMRSVDKDASDV